MKSKFLLLFMSVVLLAGCFKDEVRNVAYTMEFEVVKQKSVTLNSDLDKLVQGLEYDMKAIIDKYCDGEKKYLNLVAQAPKNEMDDQLRETDNMALEGFDDIVRVLTSWQKRFNKSVAEYREQGKIGENDRVFYTYKYVVKKKNEIFKETPLFEFSVNK